VAMHPDRSAMKEMLHPSTQGFDELLSALDGIACQIDHNFRFDRRDPVSKRSTRLFDRAVQLDARDARPGVV